MQSVISLNSARENDVDKLFDAQLKMYTERQKQFEKLPYIKFFMDQILKSMTKEKYKNELHK